MKSSKDFGITLVALVVTVVVLLILAGTTIMLSINGGIIGNAQFASSSWKNASNIESSLLANNINSIDVEVADSSRDATYDESLYDVWPTWMHIAGISNISDYNKQDFLSNSSVMNTLMSNKNALEYLSNSSVFLLPQVLNNSVSKNILLNDLIKIPSMTSNTSPEGEASCSISSDSRHAGWNALSGFWTESNVSAHGTDSNYYENSNPPWVTPNNSTPYPVWLQYKFKDIKIKPILFEYLSSYSWGLNVTHQINIQGSNDGTNWTALTENLSVNGYTRYYFRPTKNIDNYQYYRLNVLSRTETYGSRTDVLRFQVYGI